MKNLYKILVVVCALYSTVAIASVSTEIHKEIIVDPSATITGTTTVCTGAADPVVTFTGSGGTAPYTFTYNVNGGVNQTITTDTGDSVTLPVATTTAGTFNYTLVSVQDNTGTVSAATGTVVVTVVNFTVNAGNDALVCKGSDINLTSTLSAGAPSGATFSWTGPGGFTSNSQSPVIPNASAFMSGNYTVTATIGQCQQTDVVTITVFEPEIISSNLQQYQDSQWLVRCTSPGVTTGLIFINNGLTPSQQALITNYTIDWGDNSPIFTTTNPQWNGGNNLNHTYEVGMYTLIFTVNTTLGCSISKTYTVFVGNQPASPQIQLPINAQGCVPFELTFPISGISGNIPGTTYRITFSDDPGNPMEFDQSNIPLSITRTFNTNSCNYSFINGTTVENNAFGVSIQAINPCGSASSSAGPIRVSTPPTAIINAPDTACTTEIVTINDQTINGSVVTSTTCTANSGRYWEITPSTGWVVTSGSLGNNGGFPNDFEGWNNGSQNLNVQFTTPGTYTITIFRKNSCFEASNDTRVICVEAPLVPTFTKSLTEGCGPVSVATTNTTNLANQCGDVTYLWNVTYFNTNCSTTSNAIWNYTNGTTAASPSPSFNFVTPGTYSIRVTMENGCGPVQSAIQTVVVKQPPTVDINAIAPICGASSVTINPQASITNCGTDALSYQWSFPGGNPSTSTLANPGPISYSTSGSYTITLLVTNECGTTTNTEVFTISPVVMANAGTDVTICNGSTTLTGIGSGGTGSGYTYSWSPATGLSSATAQNPTASPTVTATYTLTVTNSNCTATDQVTVYVNQVTAGTIAANQTICSGGDPVAFTVQTPATGQGTLTYQWQSSTGAAFADIAGATDAIYDAPALTQTTNFRRITTSTLNGVACTATSNSITVTVNNITAGTIGNDQTICTGGTPVAIQSTSVATASGTLAYQWESSTDNVTWVTVPAATSVTYAPGALTQTTYYRRIARSTLNSVICSATSNVITITVVPDPVITVQPLTTQSLCQNQIATVLSVEATGGVGTPYSYQWYSSATSGGTGTAITNATASTYTPPTATAGTRYYYCIVTSPGAGCTVTSTVAEVIVIAAPVITTQPQSATLCAGATPAALTVAHSGGSGTPSYQWYSAPNATDAGTPIPTATSAVYQPSGAGTGVFYYYCVITFSTGGCNALTSNVAAITVNAVPSITTTQQATVCTGTAFTVTPANGGGNTVPAGTTYTWTAPTGTGFSGGSAQPTGQTSISQILVNTTNAAVTATYTVTPTSNNCTGAPFTVTVTVQPRPVMANITQTICSGESFSVTPLNNPPTTIVPAGITYTWGDPVVTGGITGGEGGSNQPQIGGSLINPTNTPQTATYTVIPVAPSGICNGQSFTITVTVNPMPSVNAPLAQTICSGGTFTVTPANGTDGVIPANTTYTWTAPAAVPGITGLASGTNQNNISGTLTNTTNTAITVPYTVTPKSGNCTGQSFTVNITVQPVPTVGNITSQTLCNGSQTNAITFTGTAAGTVYNWTNNNTSIGLAASGSGNIDAFLAINNSSSPVTATITVTPSIGTCNGPATTFTITVNPAPAVIFSQADQIICSGAASTAVTLTSLTPGSTFTWTATEPAGITGVVTSGTNTIPAQTLINTTSDPIDVVYTATAETTGVECPGPIATYTITVNPVPLVTTPQTATICGGEAFAVTPQDGGGNRIPTGTTYTWSAPSGTGFSGGSAQTTGQPFISQTLMNLTNATVTATYTVTPRLGNCSGTPFTVTVEIKPTPVIPNQVQTICSGDTFTVAPVNNAPLVLVPAGTVYTWDAPVVSGSVTGGASGTDQALVSGTLINTTNAPLTATYTVTPVADGCEGAPFTVTVTVNPVPAVPTTPEQAICSGGTFTITPVNGTDGIIPANTSYTWLAPAAIPGITGLASGTNQTNISGTLTNSANAPVTIPYTVTPTSDNCTGQPFTVNITVQPTPNVDNINSQTVCNGEQTATVTFAGTVTGTVYNWTNSNPAIGLPASGTGDITAFTAINTGNAPVTATITVTPAIGVCTGPVKTFTITVNPAPTVLFSQGNQAICSGASSSAVILTSATPNTTFTWTAVQPAGITGVITNGTNTIPAQTLVNTTNSPIDVVYIATAETTGVTCPGPSATYTITVNPVPFVNAAITEQLCSGTQANIIPADGGANNIPVGTTFTWTAANGTGFTGGNAQNTPQASINPTLVNTTNAPVNATFTVTPYFANCTGVPFTVEITVNPTAIIADTALTICYDATFTVDPANNATILPAGTVYSWSAPVVTGGITGGTSGTGEALITNTLTNPTTTPQTAAYTVTPISPQGNCAGDTFTITVTVNPEFTVASVVSDYNGFEISTAGGNDGSINLTPAGGSGAYTYTWSGPGGFAATTQDVNNLTQGTYTVTISDGLCQPIVLQFELHEPLPLVIEEVLASHVNVDCFGETTGVIEVAITQVSIAPFDYVLSLTNGTIVETVTNTNALSYVFDNLAAGTYNVQVTDANGTVKFINGIVITQPDSGLTISNAVVSNFNGFSISCNGANNGSIDLTVTGGYPGYTYNWNGPNGFSATTQDLSTLAPGAYTVVINDTTGSCSIIQTYNITEPQPLGLTAVVSDFNGYSISCAGGNNGSINITPTGGTGTYVYQWTGPNSFTAATQDIANLTAGTYQLVMSDNNGCIYTTQTYTLTEPPALSITETHANILCFGAATGAISISVAGGVPVPAAPDGYNFSWAGPNGFAATTKDISNLFAGTYTLTVTDNSGCNSTIQVTITQSPEIIITAATTPITCYGANNASITLTVSGGVGPYTAAWSNLATGLFQDNLSAGNYTITITDALNCTRNITVNIPEAPIFTVTPVVTQITCNGANNGSINLNLVGGIAPVTLTWSDGSTAGTTRNNLGPGIYTATILDGTPCQIVRTFTIVEPQLLTVGANVTHANDCNDTASGAIDLIVAGGSPPYTFTWTNGATTEDLTGITNGNYAVTVTDANGCINNRQFVINRPAPLELNVTSEINFNCAAATVRQRNTATASGGVPPFQYTWSTGIISGQYGQFMETSQNGTLTVTAIDATGCTVSQDFVVDTQQLGNGSFNASSYAFITYGLYSIIDPIQFVNTSTGDFIEVAWDFGDGSVSNEENPVHSYLREGTYTVTQTVTYPYGCVDTTTITLVIEKGYDVMIPNAFTPNADGTNDFFNAQHRGLKSIELMVYDTWGSMIYSEKGETLRGWDGYQNGKESENGNYVYRILAETFYGHVIEYNGPFTLIK
jgi:gliding motility-associated-like protein